MLYMSRLLLFFLFFTPFFNASGQRLKSKKTLRFTFYNVDCFYDTVSNGLGADTLYTPNSILNWNSEKFLHKAANIAKVLRATHDSLGPDIAGIYGVENKSVLDALLAEKALSKLKLSTVFFNGNFSYDQLGQAILYNPKKLKLLHDTAIAIGKNRLGEEPLQDMLLVKFLTKKKKDTLFVVLVNYDEEIPGFGKNVQARRINQAMAVSNKLREMKLDPVKYHMVYMGTFFEKPDAAFIQTIMRSTPASNQNILFANWINISVNLMEQQKGTVYLDALPVMFDQVHISPKLYVKDLKGWQYINHSLQVFNPIWLQHPYQRFNKYPFPMYFNQTQWIKGYSSHFPLTFLVKYGKG